MHILLLGGNFDPVHIGHLRIAHDAARALAANQIRFVPAARSPQRNQAQASNADRVKMLELAIVGRAGWSVDRRELERAAPSYTIDTLKSLRDELGPLPTLTWLIGSDQYANLHTWKHWQRLFDFANFAVAQRPAASQRNVVVDQYCEKNTILECVKIPNLAKSGQLIQLANQMLAISSTQIRNEIHFIGEAPFLLTDSVSQYIKEKKMYV
jgi:nicotinate-nucleotide adenylyltransferase